MSGLVRPVAVRAAVTIVAAYAVLYAGFLLLASGHVPEWIPPAILLAVVSLMGPPVLLPGGLAAAPIVLASLAIIGACLALSRFLWRRYPESEAFAVPIMAAVFIWVVVPVLIVSPPPPESVTPVTVNRQSAIGNRSIANRQPAIASIGNRQSVNLQSAICNLQSALAACR